MHFFGNLLDRLIGEFGIEWESKVPLVKRFRAWKGFCSAYASRISSVPMNRKRVMQTGSDSLFPEMGYESVPIIALDHVKVHGMKFMCIAMGQSYREIPQQMIVEDGQSSAFFVVGLQVCELDPKDSGLQFVKPAIYPAMETLSCVAPTILA